MRSLRRGRVGMVAAGSLVLSGLGAAGAFAAEPTPASTVTGHADWVEQAYENIDNGADLTPQQDDVTGPQRAPFGPGSHRMTIGTSTVQTELYRTKKYDGTKLSDLKRLEFSTFERSSKSGGADRAAPYLRLNVDNNGDGQRDHSLYFYPANNGTVTNGVWQNWDVTGGKVGVDGDQGPAAGVTLAQYAQDNPTSTLVNNNGGQPNGGAIAFIVGGEGGGNNDVYANGEYFVDRAIVGTTAIPDTLYDFGPRTEADGGTTVATVAPGDLHGWVHRSYDASTGDNLTTDQEFVHGPATPPAGVGSLHFSLSNDTNPDRIEQFRTATYDGVFVRDLRQLDFSTFQRPTGTNTLPQQPAYLLVNVDDNGDGTRDHTLYFFPGNNGTVNQGAWQDWSAAGGKWNVDGDQGPANTISLANYTVAHPDAKIVNTASGGGVAFTVGAGAGVDTQSNGEYFLDDITIGKVDAATGSTKTATEYDLEPVGPSASIGDASTLEGNRRATLSFPVTLSGTAGRDVTYHYATSDGTAKAGKDYVASSGTVTVPAGATTATVKVPVISDKVREGDETLTVTLSNPSYGSIADGTATGTILNDDTRVGLGLARATQHRVKVHVDTLPVAPGAPVKVYRLDKGGRTLVLKTTLNRLGRVNKVLARHYKPGTKVSFVAVVHTKYGNYWSRTASIRILR